MSHFPGKLFDLLLEDLVGLLQLVFFCHQLVHMALVRGCGHFKVIQHRGDLHSQDHSVFNVIYRLYCAQILGEFEVVVFVHKNFLDLIHVFLFTIFLIHSLQSSAYIIDDNTV